MSDKPPPFDPFGRSERTIIRPNPGGRRPTPPPVTPSPAPFAAPATPGLTQGGDEWADASASAAPVQPPPPPAAGSPAPQAAAGTAPIPTTPNENPLLRAAAPLLVLLGRLRVAAMRASSAQLMQQVANEIEQFDRAVRGSGLTPEQVKTAKYVLCATADDIVQNIPGDDRHVWTQYSMLSRFFGERVGGVRFFEELERAKADPSVNYDLLELMHAALCLGFQGIHRTSAGGAANLQMIQRTLYETLRRVKRATHEISPRWQGQAIAPQAARFRAPVWALASTVGAVLLGLYLVLRALLGDSSEAAATALLTVHPTSELGITRRVFTAPPPPPPPSTQKARICANVAPPISCLETPTNIIIRLSNIALFGPGDATVSPAFKPLIGRITQILEQEAGPIRIVGHTDGAPIRTVRFPSNFVLSVERAKAVGELIKGQLSQPGRIGVEGKGADVPIAPNTTVEGRTQNRRVEILIQRTS